MVTPAAPSPEPSRATSSSHRRRAQPERRAPARRRLDDTPVVFDLENLEVFYGAFRAVRGVTLQIQQEPDHRVHRPVGLRQDHGAALLQPDERRDPGRARRGQASATTASTSTARGLGPTEVRRRIGMVFQKPNPFPKSIYDNIAFGPRINGVAQEGRARRRSSRSRCAAPRCGTRSRTGSRHSALGMSGGQQQRLCIARTIAVEPEVVLMDEPCSALDPIATARIEELMRELKSGTRS